MDGLVGDPGALQRLFLKAEVKLAAVLDCFSELFAGGLDSIVHDFLGGFEQGFSVFSESMGVMAQGARGFKMLFGSLILHS